MGLPIFIMSHQPEWGAASTVRTLALTPGPAPSATEVGCTLSPFHPLSSWASGSFLSLDTHMLRFHNPFWALLDPSAQTGVWSFFICFRSPLPSPHALSPLSCSPFPCWGQAGGLSPIYQCIPTVTQVFICVCCFFFFP